MRKLAKGWNVAWGLWIAAFLAIEGSALYRSAPGDTLSEHVWAFLDGGPARYALVGGFLIWLLVHMLFKGKLG